MTCEMALFRSCRSSRRLAACVLLAQADWRPLGGEVRPLGGVARHQKTSRRRGPAGAVLSVWTARGSEERRRAPPRTAPPRAHAARRPMALSRCLITLCCGHRQSPRPTRRPAPSPARSPGSREHISHSLRTRSTGRLYEWRPPSIPSLHLAPPRRTGIVLLRLMRLL